MLAILPLRSSNYKPALLTPLRCLLFTTPITLKVYLKFSRSLYLSFHHSAPFLKCFLSVLIPSDDPFCFASLCPKRIMHSGPFFTQNSPPPGPTDLLRILISPALFLRTASCSVLLFSPGLENISPGFRSQSALFLLSRRPIPFSETTLLSGLLKLGVPSPSTIPGDQLISRVLCYLYFLPPPLSITPPTLSSS